MRRPAPRGGQRPAVPDQTGSPCVGSAEYFQGGAIDDPNMTHAWQLIHAESRAKFAYPTGLWWQQWFLTHPEDKPPCRS